MRRLKPSVWIPICVAAVTACLFYPVLGHDFVYDDLLIIADDARLHDPWFGLTVWGSPWWPRGATTVATRPLAQFFYWLQVQAGLASPAWFHLIDLLLYAGLCAMIANLTRQIFSLPHWGRVGERGHPTSADVSLSERRNLTSPLPSPLPRGEGAGTLAALLVGIGFAVHPLHVEVVSCVVGRSDTMAMIFTVLGIELWLRWRQQTWTWRRAATIALLVLLGGFSKENGYLLAPILVVVEITLRHKEAVGFKPYGLWNSARALWRVAACIGLVIVIAAVQRHIIWNNIPNDAFHGSLADMDNSLVLSHGAERWISPFELLGKAQQLMIWPLDWGREGRLILPANSPDYSPSMLMPTDRWDQPLVMLGLLACAAWGVFTIIAWRHRSVVLLPLACLPVMWFIPSNTVMLIGTIFAERLVMPLSLFMLLAAGLWIARLRPAARIAGAAVMAGLLIVWTVATFLYIPAWRDSKTLQTYTVSYHPQSGRFQAFFANSVLETALKVKAPQLKTQLLNAAEEHAKLSLQYWPRNAAPDAVLGVVESERGNVAEAQKYLKYSRDNAVDLHLGDWYLQRLGQLEDHRLMQQQAGTLQKRVDAGDNDPKLLAELGHLYAQLRQWPLAYKQFEKLDISQFSDEALLQSYINTAIILGHSDKAVVAEKHWITLKPDQWSVLTDAAIIAINAGQDLDEARQWLDKAIRLSPGSAEPWAGLAMWYQVKGEPGKALEAINQAIARSTSDDPRYLHYLWIRDHLSD